MEDGQNVPVSPDDAGIRHKQRFKKIAMIVGAFVAVVAAVVTYLYMDASGDGTIPMGCPACGMG